MYVDNNNKVYVINHDNNIEFQNLRTIKIDFFRSVSSKDVKSFLKKATANLRGGVLMYISYNCPHVSTQPNTPPPSPQHLYPIPNGYGFELKMAWGDFP